MSLKHSKVGPWPIIDLAAIRFARSNTGYTEAAIGSALKVCLDTANLGSSKEAFSSFSDDANVLIGANASRSYGVALCPMDTFSEDLDPIFVELSGSVTINEEYSDEADIRAVGFIGYIDTVGAAIGDGWNANNIVTNYVILPTVGNENTVTVNQQVLLKPIISAGLSVDKFLVFGVVLMNGNSLPITMGNVDICLSARYADEPITIQDRTY